MKRQHQYDSYNGNKKETEWDSNKSEFMHYDGRLWSTEQLGNYTFGYFGATYEYGEEFLCFGAGVYQKATDPQEERKFFESYWDDPIDQGYIRMGFQKYHSN